MNSPYLIPFEADHLDNFCPGRFDCEAMRGLIDMDVLPYSGHAVSMILDGRTLAIAGASEIDGVAWAWMLASDEARKRYPIFLHRSLKRGLKWLNERIETERIELAVANDFERGHKWIQRFGFAVSETQSEDGFVRYVRW